MLILQKILPYENHLVVNYHALNFKPECATSVNTGKILAFCENGFEMHTAGIPQQTR